MIRYFLISIITIATLVSTIQAQPLNGKVELDWSLLNDTAREQLITELREKLFQNVEYKIDKQQFEEHKKDKNKKENKLAIKYKMQKIDDRKLAAFFVFKKILYMYAIQYESDKKHAYYYDALGNIRYIDIYDKPYDEYPNISRQYNSKGKLESISYNLSEYDQYVFEDNGEFYGRWYKDKCYDKKAKVIMTRKLPD